MGCAAQDTAALRAMRRPNGDDAQPPNPADVARLLPAERYPNIHALAPYIYGGAAPSPETRTEDDANDPARARFDFGLESLLDGFGARLRAAREGRGEH